MNDHSSQGRRSLSQDPGDDKSDYVSTASGSSQLKRADAFRTTETRGKSNNHQIGDCNRTVRESGGTEKSSQLSEPCCAVLAVSESPFPVDPIHDTDGGTLRNRGSVTSSQEGESDGLESSSTSSLTTCHAGLPDFRRGTTSTSNSLTCINVGEADCRSGIAQTDTPAGLESNKGDAMGNTHWSHSYTGVRQPVYMRTSCRTNSALMDDLNEIYVPIIGYEMMEQRARFTVFKLHVQKNTKESWFIFRRYTDFVRLNDQLQYLFPNFRLALPPKKWFGNNFDPMFLEDRQLGLQAFLNNICGHKDIVVSDCVREFLCIDDPPGPHDSLEESRALCESLEETIYNLKKDLAEKDRKIETLTEELSHASRRIEELGIQQIISRPNDRVLPVSSSESEITDMDRRSCAEADQQDYSPEQEERPIVTSYTDEKLLPVPQEVQEDGPPVFTAIPLDNPVSLKVSAIISQSDIIEVT